MSHRAAAAAAVSAFAGVAALPADSLSSRVHSLVHSTLRAQKLQFYSKQCTQDLLLVADGLRVSFIVDVFAPLSMWLKLTQQLTELSSAFSSLRVLDLCDEGCLILNEPLFREKLRSDIVALQLPSCSAAETAAQLVAAVVAAASLPSDAAVATPAAAATAATIDSPSSPPAAAWYSGPCFINVHPSLRSPLLLRGSVHECYRSSLLCVCLEILRQLDEEETRERRCVCLPPPSLHLGPSHADFAAAAATSSASVSSALAALSLTTVCGYLLDYPVLYCTHDPTAADEDGSSASAASAASSVPASSASNNLGGCALVRFVLEAVPVTAAAAATAATAERTLVCSFTVPRALQCEPEMDAALQRWTQQRLSISPEATPRWRLPLLLSHTAVELTSVSL